MSNSIEAQLHSAFEQHAAEVSEEAVTRLRQVSYGPRRSSTGGVLVGVGVAAALVAGAGVVATDGTTTSPARHSGHATRPTPVRLTGKTIQLADAQISLPAWYGSFAPDQAQCAALDPGINTHTAPLPTPTAPYGGVITATGMSDGLVEGGTLAAVAFTGGSGPSGCIMLGLVLGGTQTAPNGSTAVTLGAYQGAEMVNAANGETAVAVALPAALYAGDQLATANRPTANHLVTPTTPTVEFVAIGAGVPATDVVAIATAATTPTPNQLEHGPAASSSSPTAPTVPTTTSPPSATSTTS